MLGEPDLDCMQSGEIGRPDITLIWPYPPAGIVIHRHSNAGGDNSWVFMRCL